MADIVVFAFTRSNPWVAVGWRKERKIVVGLKMLRATRLKEAA